MKVFLGPLFVVTALFLGAGMVSLRPEQNSSASIPTDRLGQKVSGNDSLIEKSSPSPEASTSPSAAANVLPLRQRVMEALDVHWATPPSETTFLRFHDWTHRYASGGPGDRAGLEAEGIGLARERRRELAQLIKSDPRRALELAVPLEVRNGLPSSVVESMEKRVEGRGNYEVQAMLPEGGSDGVGQGVVRTVDVGGARYEAHVYGEREGQPSLRDVPLHGIALDGHLALAESPYRRLESSEIALARRQAVDPVCSVSQANLSITRVSPQVAMAGGEIVWTCGTAHLEALHDQSIRSALGSESSDASDTPRLKRAYTEGTKRLLFIRVDFSDLPGAPFSDATGAAMLQSLDAFYSGQSYFRTGFAPLGSTGSALTPTLRMSQSAAYFGSKDPAELRSAARDAAAAAGFNLGSYHFDLICMGSVPGFNWLGLGYVGAPGAWIRNAFDVSAGVPAHELGHNFGLFHSNAWDTGGESVIGPGTSVEYGDLFDTMGSATAGQRHFNTRYKNYLDWLPNSYVRNVLVEGRYRLFAMDSTNAPTSVRALTVRRGGGTNYWMEIRQKWPSNVWVQNGVGLRWGQTANTKSLLLDATPGSAEGWNDSPLVIGRTFDDPDAGVHITPIAQGGDDPVWMDVMVRFDRGATNSPPTVVVNGSASAVAPGDPVQFEAVVSDDDDNQFSYAWDFGDGTLGSNDSSVSRVFSKMGDFVVRCVVSDMRGGTASASVVVRVGDPGTLRISGQILQDGEPVPNVRVFASGTRQVFTDSDGSYVLTGLATGKVTLSAKAPGLFFTHPAFANPVDLQSDLEEMNFDATAFEDLAMVVFVPFDAVWSFHDNGVAPGTDWTDPGFDDSAWDRGPAEFGYGGPDIVTAISFGPNPAAKFITTWFRHVFEVDDPQSIATATIGLIRDDGAVVYLNGREVFRSNMPSGPITPSTLASSVVASVEESTVFTQTINPAWIRPGRNVLAVELHQCDPGSSDTSFRLELKANLKPSIRPGIRWTSNPDGPEIAWPVEAVGFQLETATDPDGLWQPVVSGQKSANGRNFMKLDTCEAMRFFRLRQL
jgi:hypothetical protein